MNSTLPTVTARATPGSGRRFFERWSVAVPHDPINPDASNACNPTCFADNSLGSISTVSNYIVPFMPPSRIPDFSACGQPACVNLHALVYDALRSRKIH
jgi:hypothetical protein